MKDYRKEIEEYFGHPIQGKRLLRLNALLNGGNFIMIEGEKEAVAAIKKNIRYAAK